MFTVFPNDVSILPQDFETYEEAVEYGKEFLPCDFVIESTI